MGYIMKRIKTRQWILFVAYTGLLYALLYSVVVNAQNLPSATTSNEISEAFTHISGSANPELFSEYMLTGMLANHLETHGPSICTDTINTDQRQFSIGAPCISFDGVDMSKAEQLAIEYRELSAGLAQQALENFCLVFDSRQVPYLNTEEFVREINSYNDKAHEQSTNFFEERGAELLGQNNIDMLFQWLKENVLPGATSSEMDMAKFIEGSDLTANDFATLTCSQLL